MNSDIVLDNDNVILKGSAVTIEGKATFMDDAEMNKLKVSEIHVGDGMAITGLGLDALVVKTSFINAGKTNELHIDGKLVKVTGTDVKLDATERRKTQKGERRALVHDFDDGLTINYDGDYPGGVTIKGSVNVPQGMTTTGLTIQGQFVNVGSSSGPTHPTQRTDLVVEGATIRARQHTKPAASAEGVLGGVAINVTLAAVKVTGPRVSQATPGPTPGLAGTAFTQDEIVLDGTTILARSVRFDKVHGTTEHAIDVLKELRLLRAEVEDLKIKLAALTPQGG